jgi:hypothetical protein
VLGLPFLLGTAHRWPLIFAFTIVSQQSHFGIKNAKVDSQPFPGASGRPAVHAAILPGVAQVQPGCARPKGAGGEGPEEAARPSRRSRPTEGGIFTLKSPQIFPQVSTELELINEEAIAARAQSSVTMKDMFGAQLRWPLTLAMFMMISQQLSGINAGESPSSKKCHCHAISMKSAIAMPFQ